MRRLFAITTLLFLAGCSSLADLPVVKGFLTPDVVATEASLREGTYTLDPSHAALTFGVGHLGLSQFQGRFETLEASLDFDEADAESATLDVIIQMDSLDIALPEFRETLLGPDWFDAARYPQARFTATDILVTGANTGTVTGDLTLHGVTAPVPLDVTFNGGAQVPLTGTYTLGFDATGKLTRADFGLGQFSGFIGETVTVSFSGEFQRQN